MATSIPTTSKSSKSATIHLAAPAVPRLESGDRLSRAEFEKRYAAMPHLKKAELIEGVVYIQAAVSAGHGGGHALVVGWLLQYGASTPAVEVFDNTTVRLDEDNQPQPDACLRLKSGGRCTVDPQGYLSGAPELIVEVASSSASYDLHDKLNVYRRSGVAEYLVWRILDRDFDWFVLRDGQYQPLAEQSGILKSDVFPGLWLDKAALLAGDLAKIMAVLGQGLADPAHVAFVERLSAAGNKT